MKYFLLLLLFLVSAFQSFSQAKDRELDSLILVLRASKEDTNKVNLLNRLSHKTVATDNLNVGLNYATMALSLAEKIEFKKGVARAYDNIGIVYYHQGNYSEALKNTLTSLKITEEIKDKQGIAGCYIDIGNIYFEQNNTEEVLKNYLPALKLAEEIGDKRIMGSVLNNLGNVYSNEGNFAEALKNYQSSLELQKKIGDKQGECNALSNVGIVYYQQGDYLKAVNSLMASIDMCNEIGDKHGIASSYNNLGETYVKLQKLQEAKECLQKGLVASKEIGSKYLVQLSYDNLSDFDSITGNFKEAYQYQRLSSIMNDSLFNEKSSKQISQLRIQYETDKKEKMIALLNSENKIKTTEIEKEKLIKYVAFGFATLTILIAFLFFNNYRIRNKARELTIANEMRQRISRDLHDEIGAGLTSISMICEQAKIKEIIKNTDEKVFYDKVSSQSRKLSEQLSEVVWATNPENDNLASLLSYMRNHVSNFFGDSSMRYSLNLPEQIPELSLKPDVGRNLFFVLKEALNNCAKHSHASLIEILFRVDMDKNYALKIDDNGKGIDYNSMSAYRSGFGNMRRRIEEINGKFEIKSEPGKGTHIEISGSLS